MPQENYSGVRLFAAARSRSVRFASVNTRSLLRYRVEKRIGMQCGAFFSRAYALDIIPVYSSF